MTRDDIIRMALEAGFLDREESSHIYGQSRFDEEICVEEYSVGEIVERFAALVAAHEREACAKVCDAKVKDEYATGLIDHHEIGWTESCAFAIRARGEA